MKRIVSVILVILLFANLLLFSLNVNPAVAEEGLVGHWKFDEGSGATAYDSSGYAHDGTVYGASWVSGKNGTALGFDGVEDRVEVEHDANLDPGTGGFTLTAWVKPSLVVKSPDHQRIMWKNSGVPMLDGYYLSLFGSSFIFGVGDGSSKAEPMGGDAEAGVWYFVAGVRDRASGKAAVYLNGVQVDERTDASGDIDYTGKLLFGGRNDYSAEFFNGTIDDVRIYGRTLATNEILELYQASKCVHNLNTGSSYATIQEAIDAANAGDTILADSGVYYENVVVNKSVSLIGENEYTTIIDGNQTGNVVVVTADAVNITGFTIRNCADATDAACVVLVNCTNILVEDISTVGNKGVGIGLWATSNSTIRNVTASGGMGISLQLSNGNVLENNSVTGSFQAAILLWDSGNNTLRDNRMGKSGFAVISGGPWVWLPGLINDVDTSNTVCGKPIYYWIDQHNKTVPSDGGLVLLVNCSDMTVRDLNISHNLVGVGLYETTDSIIENVSVTECANGITLAGSNNTVINDCFVTNGVYWSTGIFLHTSSNNTLTGNTISNMVNQQQPGQPPMGAGVAIFMGGGNRIYHNNFVNDTVSSSVSYSTENVFDNGYAQNGFGNYWSDYSGADLFCGSYQNETGSDGVGDTPFIIDIGNQDHYPLIKPYGIQHDIGITNVTTAKTITGQGYSLNVSARIVNYGLNAETFNITLCVSPQPSISDNSLVGYWKFDEGSGTVAYDSSGNSNTGILVDGPTWVQGRDGRALSFDGVDDYVEVNDSASLDVTNQITAECWVKWDHIDGSQYESMLFGKAEYGALKTYYMELQDGKVRATIGDGDPLSGWHYVCSTTSPVAGVWYHLAMTYDGQFVRIFVNGVEENSVPYEGTIATSDDPLNIGRFQAGTRYVDGIIDELKICNRALSPEEIRAEYERAPETVQTQTVTLTGRDSTAITLTWDTTGFAKGNYTISVVADSVSGEMDINDNNFISGIVTIAKVGDINADGKVDVKDVYAVAKAYGTSIEGPNPPSRTYVAECDINGDNKVDVKDYYIVCKHYGEVDP